ncbi:DegT/DnrJ/EryC1/StrS family aminotransferase [Streptomyces coeruleorubidus]|uniref:DegT/DnrJ/EryC1/StrS family aminotransferase n=1 Tax=Streptomyces coeruleorubidus TaxID=116188 RepID=UPI003F53FDC7
MAWTSKSPSSTWPMPTWLPHSRRSRGARRGTSTPTWTHIGTPQARWCARPRAPRCGSPRASWSCTTALLPVDMYGHPADMIEMRRIADRHVLALVEDACIALGAEIDGRRLGRHADVTCFSFSPGKHLGAMGAAGACTTQNAALADRIHKLASDGQARGRHYDPKPRIGQHHETEGHNQRMDEMQAAILRAKLPHLDETLAVRRAHADRYTERLVGLADLPGERTGFRHAWRNYVIDVPPLVA